MSLSLPLILRPFSNRTGQLQSVSSLSSYYMDMRNQYCGKDQSKQNIFIVSMLSFSCCCQDSTVQPEEIVLYRGDLLSPSRVVLDYRQSQVNEAIVKDESRYRMFAVTHYEQLREACVKQKTKFTDSEFPPNDKSMGKYEGRKRSWARLSDRTNDALVEKVDPDQILQLRQEDSYFLSALAALAQNINNVKEVLDQECFINSEGIYKLNICVRGKSKAVIVDDYLPVLAENSERMVECKLRKGLIWVALFQKAYAKINGSYANIEQGFAHEVFATFTLAPCLYYVISLNFTHQLQDKYWTILTQAEQNGFAVVCGSRKVYTSKGIRSNRTYCFLGCSSELKANYRKRVVKLRNLAGQIPSEADLSFKDDGQSIQIELVEFMRNFQLIDIAHVRSQFSSHFYSAQMKASEPHFLTLQISEEIEFYITLQKVTRTEGHRLVLILGSERDNKFTSYEYVCGKKEEVYSDVSIHCKGLQPGRYVVYCQSYTEGQCLVRVYCSKPLLLKPYNEEKKRFLEHIFFADALASEKELKLFGTHREDWYYSKLFYEELGWGYIAINLGQNSRIKCQVQYRAQSIAEGGFRVLNKKDKEYIRLIEANQSEVLVFEHTGNVYEGIGFPPKSLNLKLII